MIRTTLAITYFSYLIMAGGMFQSVAHAEKPSAASYQENLCRLMADSPACAQAR